MVKTLTILEEESNWYGIDRQRVSDEDTTVFRVHNLSECPEDAIIGRDLFDAYDFIRAVEYGMKLAQEGYTSIKVEVETVKE